MSEEDTEETENNVIYIDAQQGDIVEIANAIKEAAESDEISCLFITAIDDEGVLKMGRAGGFTNLQDFLLLLGGFEVQKDYVLAKMLALDEEDFVAEEEDEEYDEED